jgi:hypothetical protein
MKRYYGMENAPPGAYLSLSSWEFTRLDDKTIILPGERDKKYVKVPAALAMVTGPFAGLVFIIFLPLVGIVGLIGFLFYKLWQGAVAAERRTLQLFAAEAQGGKTSFTPGAGAPGLPHEERKRTGPDRRNDGRA